MKVRPHSDGAPAPRPPRAGWAEAARRMHAAGDDRLLDPLQSSTFDEWEWEWDPVEGGAERYSPLLRE